MFLMLGMANAQDITVFDFDGTTPTTSSWADSFAGQANPLSDAVNSSPNAGKYIHTNMWSNVSISPVNIDPRVYSSFEVSVYTPTSTTGTVIIQCVDAAGQQLDWYSQPITTAGAWTKYTRNLTFNKNVAKVVVGFNFGGNPAGNESDIVYFDNLVFKKTSSSSIELYNQTFFASWSQWGSWSGAPSTQAGKWFGGVDLQTTDDGTMNLERWWDEHEHILNLASTNAAVIIPDINVAGFDSLQFSIDARRNDAAALPIVDVKVGAGDWVSVATLPSGAWWSWANQVVFLKDANGNLLNNVSTISLRISNATAGNPMYLDNIKVLGKVHYEFTGATSTDPTVSSNWVGGFYPGSSSDVIVSGGHLILNQNTTYKSITVNPTAKLTLNDTKSLTVSNLLLKSDATGTATFVDKNTSSPAAISATVQQYLPVTDRNWYVSSPVSSATNADLSTGASVVEYNEQLGTWPAVSGTLSPMKGYISTAGSAGTGTLSFSGNLNTGSKSILLSKKGAVKSGFNLVGNPYPSYLNWTESLANASNCQTTIWYRTKSAGAYAFHTYNASGNLGVPLSTTGYIPPMQAFWVRTIIDGSILAFNNSMRLHGNGSSNLLKAAAIDSVENQIVRLQVSNGVNADETVIYFNSNADNSFDTFDSPKMSANNANTPEIYTISGTEKLVINGMKALPGNIEIPLGFGTGSSSDFALTATELKNLEAGTHIVLKDNLLNSETELAEGIAYNFSSEATTPNTGRFSLIFRAPGTTTGVKGNTNISNARIFVNAANQIVIVAPNNSGYAIYNSIGEKLREGFTTSNHTIVPGGFKAGMYVVTLSEGGRNYGSKVIIK